MPWARLDDGLDEHPKIEAMLEDDELTGLAAVGLWALMLTNSSRRLTDGHVTPRVLARIAPQHGCSLIGVLEQAGLMDTTDERRGYTIHDYHEYNPSADEVKSAAKSRSAAARVAANARWHSNTHASADASTDRPRHASASAASECDRNAPARPVPVPNPKSKSPDVPTAVVAPARERTEHLDEDLVGFVVGVLQRGVDGLTSSEPAKNPTRAAVGAALSKFSPSPDVARAVAIDVRSIAQSQNRAPNIVGLYAQRLAQVVAVTSSLEVGA
jgi:hypothetical protein